MIQFVIFIAGIVLGIVISLVYRFTKRSKKAFFNGELRKTETSVWADEFARFTTLQEREKVRRQYDQINDAFSRADAEFKKNTSNKKVEDERNQLEAQLKSLKTSLDDFDTIINGAKPTNEYPDGIRGIEEAISSKREKIERIKYFIKEFC